MQTPCWCHVSGGNFENSRCCILNAKDDTELKSYIFLGVPTHGDDKNLVGLVSFEFRIL